MARAPRVAVFAPAMIFASALALGIVPASALAHITLETPQATVGSYYKAVLNVPHGCAGSATTRLRVRIPDGVTGVKPKPKAGWTLQTLAADREIIWSGRLPDAYFDQFTFLAHLGPTLAAGTVVYFPVVQECEHGIERWIDTPASGQDTSPAPALKLLPK